MSSTAVKVLIEKAGANVGSEYRLAKLLGIPQSHVSGWKSGDRTCTPEDRARLAGIAHEDAVQELVRATLEKHAGTRKGEQLTKLLGKSLQAIGGVLALGLLALGSLTFSRPAEAAPALHDVYYVKL
jgi:predicted transcriptional regulator